MLRFVVSAMAVGLLAFVGSVARGTPTPPVQVWFSPNNDTADRQLFRHPELWGKARSQISVLKRLKQVDGRGTRQTNSLSALTDVDAFRVLRLWGIKLAIEAPAIKKWDCTSKKALEYTLRMVDNVSSADGVVDYISMDGPLVSGIRGCCDTVEFGGLKDSGVHEGVRYSGAKY